MKLLLYAAAALGTLASAAPTSLTARATNSASCTYDRNTRNMFKFWVTTWGDWDNDWGQGYLDNLRGQCGSITDWQFSYSGSNGLATFTTSAFIVANCVEDALWLASNHTGAIWDVHCALA
ncbi:hypothetical protein BZA05DRAFT_422619 [Tricharina praecox]|uniref:uncharacterized protein n=1 Tax=Tricharina praecox TaxID=43433 RepID=UPI00221EE60B|nr:uncharacterized protein BZA05DRAFT_422619 [Tricharina praecox]KAI5842278.1 hypothetical protein BZA05DRAFT_422619 [Tricharina praecox]